MEFKNRRTHSREKVPPRRQTPSSRTLKVEPRPTVTSKPVESPKLVPPDHEVKPSKELPVVSIKPEHKPRRGIKTSRSNGGRAVITTVIIVILVTAFFIVSSMFSSPGESNSTGSAIAGPTYKTVVPDGKTIDSLGGWQRVSPPGKDPVFAFTDKVGDVSLRVSEQPLGDDVDADKKIKEIAASFYATDKLVTRYATVYIGTSAKGPQSVIFAKNNILIMIQSSGKLSNDAWETYINTLNFQTNDTKAQF